MDILRRGYKTWMVEWNADATQFPVRWFRADPKAQVFPGLSAFGSSNWDPWWVGNELGEQWPRNRTYDKGANPLGYAGLNYCGPEYAFQIGGFHGITPPITTLANGYSPCCLTINMGIQIPSGFGIKPWQWKGMKFRSGFGLISDQGLTVVQHYAGRLAWSASSTSTTTWASTYAGLLAWSASSSSTTPLAQSYAGLLAWNATSSSSTILNGAYGEMQTWVDEANVYSGNAQTFSQVANCFYNFYGYQSPPANGDTLRWTVSWPAGTWLLKILGITYPDYGKTDVYFNGTLIGTIDWYSATVVYNVEQSLTLTIATGGTYVLETIVNGKNSSSTNYYFVPTKLWIQ